MTHQILEWSAIRENYQGGALVLGNGASISVDGRFSYGSLKQKAEELGTITPALAKVFRFFNDTPDFELVLRMLWHARNVNSALEIGENQTTAAYADVRDSLIQTVRAIHVQPAEVRTRILRVAGFMEKFKHVISLNYDLTTYWAMMEGNEANPRHAFKDCFVNRLFDEDWRKFSDPLGQQTSCTTVFYPHGNLALCRDRVDAERKLQATNGSPLLETILARWESGAVIPLFVSEGTAEQKRRAILGSAYLQTVFRAVLPNMNMPLVIYGWGVGEQDVHILEQLGKAASPRIAVSVYRGNQAYCDQVIDRIEQHFPNAPEVEFFDSESDGCWVYGAGDAGRVAHV